VVRLHSPNRPNKPGLLPRSAAWRLGMLVLGAATIGLVVRELGRPRGAQPIGQAPAIELVRPVASDPAPQPPADPAQFRELLRLADWNAERFAALAESDPLSDAGREQVAELVWRLHTFDSPQLAAWARGGKPVSEILSTPDEHRGELVELTGRVTKVTRRDLPQEIADRLELPAVFECEMTLDDGAGTATIVTSRVPRTWLEMSPLDAPASAAGVLMSRLTNSDDTPRLLAASREIAWHPTTPQPPHVSLGESILGELGVDVGQLELVRQRSAITATEREAFYQILDAAGRIGTNQLTRFAQQQLPSIAEQSQQQQPQLAREVQARAAKGLYSVAPLFNDPAIQVGELVALEGGVRRVQRIDVGQTADGAASDVARRFGIDHYYELDLFTDDSQNNPIVVCVRELPPGFPIGDGLHEPVRIAGWFVKVWNFESLRATLPNDSAGEPTPPNLRQFAPLLIGRSPIPLTPPTASTTAYASYFAATLFLILLAAVWFAGWRLFRDDRRFSKTLARQYSLPEGESLNELQFDLSEAGREHD
jgi:hypothetical protein